MHTNFHNQPFFVTDYLSLFCNETIDSMNNSSEQSLWELLGGITDNLKYKRLADVFRFVSFKPFETFGPHNHIRIEINYVKKGSCIIRLDNNESIVFNKDEMMIISSNVDHFFEAGSNGCTLMQLEFLPEVFSKFDLHDEQMLNGLTPATVFSNENKIIKIVNNVRIMRAVQRIVNELKVKHRYYNYLVLMYYAELLILINRHMEDNYLPMCNSDSMKKAISFIRIHYQSDVSITHVAESAGIGERYLRKQFAKYLNLSPLDYLTQVRINKSIELLRNTEMSIKEVCFTCGFKSPQYFSRIFKQQIGMTPKELTK